MFFVFAAARAPNAQYQRQSLLNYAEKTAQFPAAGLRGVP